VEEFGVATGGGVWVAAGAFLLGHDKPIDRLIRSSAHNYYIDLAYNFASWP
jgi:hypothetical protein